MKRSTNLLGAGALAVGLLGATVAPALAGEAAASPGRLGEGPGVSKFEKEYGLETLYTPYTKCKKAYSAKICYDHVSDMLYVKDLKKDGYSARVWWQTGSRSGACINKFGKGKWASCNKNFKEGKQIWVYVPGSSGSKGFWSKT